MADEAKERRRQEAEERSRRLEHEELRQQKVEEIRKEEERLERLRAHTRAWRESQEIRAFVAAIVEQQGGPNAPEGFDLAKWSAWALSQADRLDPLADTPPSILDERHKWEREPGIVLPPWPSPRVR